MSDAIEWLDLRVTDAPLRTAIEAAVDRELRGTTAAADILVNSARRRVVRADAPGGGVVLKRASAAGAAPFRDVLRRPFLGTPAHREWHALASAKMALRKTSGAPLAPAPLGRIRAGGMEFGVTEWIAGEPFWDRFRLANASERRRWIDELARALRALATARVAHGDLHLGNILVTGEQLAFLDWKESHVNATAAAIARDLAELEFSLARSGVRRAARLRLRKASLGLSGLSGVPGAIPARTELRAAAERAEAAAQDHYRGRTRRALVAGRQFAVLAPSIGRGMRVAELSDDRIARAIEAHEGAAPVLKDDERSRVTRVPADESAGAAETSWVVKEVTKGGIGRRLADPFRGSPARRGWLGGHGLLVRGLVAARPLAFAELSASRSVLLLEDASPSPCLEDSEAAAWKHLPEEALAGSLLAFLLALHRRGVDHGDLQASHLFGNVSDGKLKSFTLIDLEAVRFERKLSDDARLRALSELNASLPELRLSNELRNRTFDCYARALPFAMPREEALRAIVRRSKARNHRWGVAER